MKSDLKFNWLLKILPWSIIGIGLIVRIVVYFQNRNLLIDEANIVRNIYERSYAQLFAPLNYEQFAPPLFLCISKFNMTFLSSAEWALRLFPFICGLINLFLFYHLLKKANLKLSIFYPLFLFATGMIYVRYASELKQYSSDILVTQSLWLLAIKFQISKSNLLKFSILWLFVGSLSIWLSMPSVFILAAVGFYYFYEAYKLQCLKKFIPFSIVLLLWLIQFFVYYFFVLKSSTNSEYLQNEHFKFEFILNPKSIDEWKHNRDALITFLAC